MIFTCGVRFMRLRSSSVSGRASGSLSAAWWRSASVMASKRLQSVLEGLPRSDVVLVVSAFFMWLGSACGDDANGTVTQGVGHVEDPAIDHTNDAVTVFAIVLAIVETLSGEWILEHPPGGLKAYAVVG